MTISENTKQNHIYNRSSPFLAKLKERYLLTKAGSTKETYHITLDIGKASIRFNPGDSIGVFPENDPKLVHRLLSLLSSQKDEMIIDPRSNEAMSVESYLSRKVNFSRISSSLLELLMDKTKDHDKKNFLHRLLEKENKEQLTEYLREKDLIDILSELQEEKCTIQELSAHTSPLLPRFYSISSSQVVYPGEVHLTIALFSIPHRNEKRYGVASHFLCHLALPQQTPIPIYIQPAGHFKLPSDPTTNIIMVGPGTGIAPYRAFLQERVAQNASGENWLFFGERNKSFDYFYQDYWEALVTSGKLKMETAFSRDQEEKIYVQHKLLEHAKDIWTWLEGGAYFYVCGDAHRMAKDVEKSLLTIIQNQGNLSEEDAKAYFKSLKQAKRYLADVY